MMLTKEQIEEIKQKHKEGMIPKDIAQEYGVTKSCIYKHLRKKDNKIDIDSLIPVKVVSSDVLTFKMDNHTIELKKDELFPWSTQIPKNMIYRKEDLEKD